MSPKYPDYAKDLETALGYASFDTGAVAAEFFSPAVHPLLQFLRNNAAEVNHDEAITAIDKRLAGLRQRKADKIKSFYSQTTVLAQDLDIERCRTIAIGFLLAARIVCMLRRGDWRSANNLAGTLAQCAACFQTGWKLTSKLADAPSRSSTANLGLSDEVLSWWIESSNPAISLRGFLVLRRILRFALNEPDPDVVEAPISSTTDRNAIRVPTAYRDGKNVEHAAYPRLDLEYREECASGVYLDPVVFGIRYVDDAFLQALTIAHRVYLWSRENRDPALTKVIRQTAGAIRVTPILHEAKLVGIDGFVSSLVGPSGGGILVSGVLATSWGIRINRESTASIAVAAPDESDHPLPADKVIFGTVEAGSMKTKLSSAKTWGINSVHLHQDQACEDWEGKLDDDAKKLKVEKHFQLSLHLESNIGANQRSS